MQANNDSCYDDYEFTHFPVLARFISFNKHHLIGPEPKIKMSQWELYQSCSNDAMLKLRIAPYYLQVSRYLLPF